MFLVEDYGRRWIVETPYDLGFRGSVVEAGDVPREYPQTVGDLELCQVS